MTLNPAIKTLILKYNDFHSVDASFNFYPELELVDLSSNQLVSRQEYILKICTHAVIYRSQYQIEPSVPSDAYRSFVWVATRSVTSQTAH